MKDRLFSLAAVLALIYFAPAASFADDKLDAVVKELEKAWGEFESMTADITINTSMQGMTNKQTGTIEFDHKGGKYRYRMDMKTETDMNGQKMTSTQTMVSDGDYIYTLSEAMGQKHATKMKPLPGQMTAPVGKEMFDSLEKQYELKVLPDESVDGDAAYVIEAKPKQNMGSPTTTMKMYFVKKHGIMVKTLGLDASGAENMSMLYKNIKVNPKIDPSRFVFKAPEGVQVMDMTNQ